MHILFSILFLFIIKESLSDPEGTISYVFKIDLKKYEKVTVPATDRVIIFDSSDFKKDEEIYFKITADSFTKDYLLYKFFDDGRSMNEEDLDNYKKATPSKTENEYKNGDIYYMDFKFIFSFYYYTLDIWIYFNVFCYNL